MRLTAKLFVIVLLASGVPHPTNDRGIRASTSQSDDSSPRILNAQVKGKKLIVTGQNFAPGALILVDGEPQKTKNDSEFPSTMLIAKKAGKKIANNTAVNIQIQSNGSTSDKFGMFKGRVITFADLGKPIVLKPGERFLLFLEKGGYEFNLVVLDTTVLQKVDDVELIPGSQGVFEAKRTGTTMLQATGELPCHNTTPACLAPTLFFEFTVTVTEIGPST